MKPGDRVEIPPHYDLWMRGARFGQVTKVGRTLIHVRMDATGRVAKFKLSDQDGFRLL